MTESIRPRSISRRGFLKRSIAISAFGVVLTACQQTPASSEPTAVAPPAPAATTAAAPATATGATPAAFAPKSEEKAKLTYLQLDDPVLKKIRGSIVEDFQKATGNTIENIVASNDQLETKRNALFAAGTPPDVFVGQGGSQNIAALVDILLDLGPYIQDDPKTAQVDQYYERALVPMKYQGKTLEWPAYAIVMVLAYNKGLFDAAGVKYPTNDWTYEDLIAAGQKLVTKDSAGKPKTWGVSVDRRSYIEWMNGLWARGSDIFTEDLKKIRLGETAGVDTLQWMFDKVNKYEMSPGPGQDIPNGFAGGNYAMDWGAHVASWPAFRKGGFKWDIVMLPKGPVERGPRIAMDTWAAAKSGAHPEQAFRFIMFGSSFEQASKLAEAGFAPPRKDVAEAVWLKGSPGSRPNDPQNIEAYFQSMDVVHHVQPSRHFLKVTLDIVGPHLDLMFEKKKSPAEAAQAAAEEANAYLATQTSW